TALGWEELAGSSTGGGISASNAPAYAPSVAVGADGTIYVAWTQVHAGGRDIHVARFDATLNGGAGGWVALGGSLAGGGISGTGAATDAKILATSAGPVVAWLDASSGTTQVYVKRFDGAAWQSLGAGAASGTGVSNHAGGGLVGDLAAVTDGTRVALAWAVEGSNGVRQIFLTEYSAGVWAGRGTSASGTGVSGAIDASLAGSLSYNAQPTLAYHGGDLFVAWQAFSDQGAAVVAVQYQGASAVTRLVNGVPDRPAQPVLTTGGGDLQLLWVRTPLASGPANLYAMAWNGSQFVEELPAEASPQGISPTTLAAQSLAAATDSSGRVLVVWQDVFAGRPEIYARGEGIEVGTVYRANAQSVQAILDGNDLGAGDVIVVEGAHAGFSVAAQDAGVTIYGAPGATIAGDVTIAAGAANVTVQRLAIAGKVGVDGANGFTLSESTVSGGVVLDGGSGARVVYNRISSTGTGVALVGSVSGAVVERNGVTASTNGINITGRLITPTLGGTGLRIAHNDVHGATTGLRIGAAATGTIEHNDFSSAGTVLNIDAAFTGGITDNTIHGGTVGVRYAVGAALAGNEIFGNATGVQHLVTDPAQGLGFVTTGLAEGRQARNDIHGNSSVGVALSGGRMQGQLVRDNTVGVNGSGTLGGPSLALGNDIDGNGTGVAGFTGTIQFNRFGGNGTAIVATSEQRILHNVFHRNATHGVLVSGRNDVRIFNNTFFAPTGDNVRIQSSSSEVELRNNVMWAQSGYDIYVANDSQSGFFSDYNNLYATGDGRVGYWTKDFVDVLDWQADIAKFDLHSIGATVVNPDWARPAFADLARDDYTILPPVAQLRHASPTVDAGDARADNGVPPGYVNRLANAGFESDLAGWVVNPGAAVRTASPVAYEGSRYFSAGNIEEGFAAQTVDLLAAGYSPAQLDAQDLEVVFGGRLRSAAEAAVDRGEVRVTFIGADLGVLGTTNVVADDPSDRWSLVGGRADIPVGTRSVRFEFRAYRDTGSSNDAWLDQAFLYVRAESEGADQGAFGFESTDLGLAGAPRIALRFPDLYTDWEKDRPLDIRWETFGNAGESPVRIDLLQDTADGPALVATIAASTPDDGLYTWIPSSSPANVDFGTYGLRIQVSLVANPAVIDRSQETFTVPEDGADYWVDDRSNVGDEYTPDAIGDNRNTGKLATAPKPNPVNLFRVYELSAGDTVHVDTGNYPLIDPLKLSGTTDYGLGRDEGFIITGPTDVAKVAALFPAIPGNRTSALIELVDADFVNVSHLTLREAQRGIHVHTGSDNFSGTRLTAFGHASDGMRIDTNNPLWDISHLTAYANGGYGIWLDGPLGDVSNVLAHGNTQSGVYIQGTTAVSFTDSLVYGNGRYGIELSGVSGARVEANEAYGNQYGIVVSGSSTQTIIGNTDLSLGRGNRVYDNTIAGISASNNVLVVGNTVWGHVGVNDFGIGVSSNSSAWDNVVYGNYTGITASSTGSVNRNRVYANTSWGIVASSVDLSGNVVYSNAQGVRWSGGGHTFRNNLVYDNATQALDLWGSNLTVANNTLQQSDGDLVRLYNGSTNANFRNNFFWADDGLGLVVDSNSQLGFQSDYNIFRLTGTGQAGQWQGVVRPTFNAWRAATFTDANSLALDPQFVDPDGADGVLGYASLAQDGRDDDFHLQSRYGSFHGGSLAPVRNAISGLPMLLPGVLALDANQSAGIDRGNPSDAFANEPAPNGGYVNIGAYGNTAQASKSPAQYVLVLKANGGETVSQGAVYEVQWRAAGFAGTVDLSWSSDGGATWNTLSNAEANDGRYDWNVDAATFAAGTNYLLRAASTDTPAIFDTSDRAFTVSLPIRFYYVNDGSTLGDQYATAIGDDANDGLDPSRPKASIRSVLDTYDLNLGDVVLVDVGSYLLTTNINIAAQDSGVTIQGPTADGARAVLNRGNTSSSSYVFQFSNADRVTLANLAITGAYYGVFAASGADADLLTVRDSEIYGNANIGVYITTGNDDVTIEGNVVYRNASTGIYVNGLEQGRVLANHVWGNASAGIDVNGSSAAGARVDVLGNVVHDNSSTGIAVTYGVRVAENVVYGHSGSGQYGITAYYGNANTLVEDNEIYGNFHG
ncbi:right-handed parallel beta-helix repeat-containing protein, partial [Luteitalea sp.]|uniref:right-handed parallel beta-helix repeat-containing protein n=1 Tax=Luteitalea sp. TaxID=2004800 RepID=UPI0025C4A659